MKNLIKIALTCFVLAGTISSGFAKDPMTESLREMKGEEFDKMFLSQMIDHHKQGVEMAQLAIRQAQNPVVKQFAQKTADMQQKDIEQLKEMLGGGHSGHEGEPSTSAASTSGSDSGSSHPMAGGKHEQMKMETMSKLQSAQGSEFDQAFVDEMLKHHQMATEMAQLAIEQSSREDVREFAKKTVRAQSKEMTELKSLKS